MQAVWKGYILKLDVDRDCLQPFVKKDSKAVPDGFVGLGTFTDSLVRFARYAGDSSLMALKNHVIDTTIGAQDADGYIGFNPPAKRIREAWDIHELNYIVYGLTTNYLLFNHQPSLTAARTKDCRPLNVHPIEHVLSAAPRGPFSQECIRLLHAFNFTPAHLLPRSYPIGE